VEFKISFPEEWKKNFVKIQKNILLAATRINFSFLVEKK